MHRRAAQSLGRSKKEQRAGRNASCFEMFQGTFYISVGSNSNVAHELNFSPHDAKVDSSV